MLSREKSELVTGLRTQIAALEASPQQQAEARFKFGLEAVDARLPGGGLARCGVHEVTARAYGDMGAAIGFAAALAARASQTSLDAISPRTEMALGQATPLGKEGLIVWCQQGWGTYDLGPLYGPGLAAFGIDPSRLLLVNPAREPDMLWVLEECVRAGVFAAVVGEVPATSRHFNLRASRRLHLGAEDTGTPLILLRGHGEMLSPSAALTRWKVSAAPTEGGMPRQMTAASCWQVELEKCKGGQSFSASLSWDGLAGAFRQVPHPQRQIAAPIVVRSAEQVDAPMREAG